ncbi:MAG: glutamate--tRNA ligase, partial [Gammaproteobacteria bacterium]
VSLGGPIVDIEKLYGLSGRYIREDLSDVEFAAIYGAWAFSPGKLKKIVPLLKERVERLSDVAHLGHQFVAGELAVDKSQYESLKLDQDQIVRVLQFSLWRLEELTALDQETVEVALKNLAGEIGMKLGELMPVLFLAITGHKVAVSVFATVEVLGLDLVRTRLRRTLAGLGGVSKKQAKTLEKEYASLPKQN